MTYPIWQSMTDQQIAMVRANDENVATRHCRIRQVWFKGYPWHIWRFA